MSEEKTAQKENEMKTKTPIIELKEVVKAHTKKDEHKIGPINLKIFEEEFVAIYGPSGSGKSTLLHLISGLMKPDSGDVIVKNTTINKVKNTGKFRAKHMGYIFEHPHLFLHLTASENVQLPMLTLKQSARKNQKNAMELLEWISLDEQANIITSKLQQVQRQSIAIARAFANYPPIILADEPTGTLSSTEANSVLNILQDFHRKTRCTMVLASHDQTVAASAERIIYLYDGKITPAKKTL